MENKTDLKTIQLNEFGRKLGQKITFGLGILFCKRLLIVRCYLGDPPQYEEEGEKYLLLLGNAVPCDWLQKKFRL